MRSASQHSLPPRLLAALNLIVVAVSIAGCGHADPTSPTTVEPAARPVRVVEAVRLTDGHQLRVPAALRTAARAELAFLQPGTLAERAVRLGQSVVPGERLAMLYNPTLQPGVAAAQARVDEAASRLAQLELDTRRQQTLVERKLAATDTLDQVRTRRDAARAALDQARAQRDEASNQLAEAVLRAPFAGRIAAFHLEPGDFAAAGQPVMTLFGEGPIEAEIALPASLDPATILTAELLRINDGQRAEAEVVEFGQARPGQPRPLVLRAVTADTARWISGEPVQAELRFAGIERIAVPLAALVDPGTGSARLFRVRNDRAERVAVTTGRLLGERVIVDGPITAGDRIVVAGQAQLLDGEAVRVLP
ncbi:MAG: efflux RND transporter periplasmic adaptor subunit [Wenzhouxiangellaceae bacterium]|nr:efflux RND transporter periplasmic adaptor subunit [Wenzhouxiangellaceae bacterium]